MQLESITSEIGNHPLVPSLSIQSKEDGSYFHLPEELDYDELDSFLSGLDIERKDIGVKGEYLLTLFHQEMSTYSWMKWSSLDHALEKLLQWPLLSAHDLGLETKNSAWRRVRPAERSILLKSTWGLVKAYAVQGFVRGLELGLFTSIHIFIYSMLFYRLVKLIQTGSMNVDEFRTSFIGSDQKGIDSLVRLLAGLEAQWLKLILTSPLIIGGLQSISSMMGARRTSSDALNKYTQIIDAHLQTGGGWLRDGVYEYLPGISSMGFLSLSGKLQKLESLVRWDGRLSSEERRQIFDAVCEVAVKGKKSTQLNALTYLAKIAHGVGFTDLPRLKEVGYSTEKLITILYTKGKTLEFLTTLRKEEAKESKPLRCQAIQSLPQRLYRQYLLWWLLGLKTHVLKQQLPAMLLKGIKLTIEFYFFQMIVLSILEAISCPDKPGFKFGDGYQDWASDYTADCFTTRINLFRTIDTNESVDALVAEIPQYHLTELISLDLSGKYLTSNEASQIIQALVQQKAPLKTLSLFGNFLTFINESMLSGLTQLNYLELGGNYLITLNNGVFSGLTQLNYLNLAANNLGTLNNGTFHGLTQLNHLELGMNYLITLNDGVFSGLTQLNILSLRSNYLSTFSNGVFSKLTQLKYLYLGYNRPNTLSDDMFNDGLTQLNYLDLTGNGLNTLSNGVFSGLSQLNVLFLGYNQLSTLNGRIFSGLSQLQSLDLSNNYFSTTALMDIFSQLPPSLIELNIAFNPMNYIPKNFSILLPVSLQSLHLGGDYIPSTLTREFMQYFPMQLINFSATLSSISNITPGCFLDFPALTTLDLSGNQLQILSNDAFIGLTQLNTLYLYDNQLSILNDGVFSQLPKLNYLNLYGNKLSILSDGVFIGLTQLHSLYLYRNQLSMLSDGVFNELTQLNTLKLYDNQLSMLSDGVFNELTQLNSLNLRSNNLSTLNDGMFNGLNQLRSLSLSSNRLKDTAIKNLTHNFPYQLNYLFLDNNQIGNEGALALAEILPCANVTFISFMNNSVNDTTIVLAAQRKALQKVCDDKRCHANLPASQSCNVPQASSGFSMMTWGRESSIEITDEDSFADMKSSTANYFYSFFASHSSTNSSLPSLPSPDSLTKDSLITVGAIAATVIGFGLLYKNATMVRNVVNAGCQLLRRCFYGTRDDSKMSMNPHLFHSQNKTSGIQPMESHLSTTFLH